MTLMQHFGLSFRTLAVVALIAGILILLVPRLLNYVVYILRSRQNPKFRRRDDAEVVCYGVAV